MITSERNVYIAGHVTQPVKDALIREAKRQGISQSEFISQAITEKLRLAGTEITVIEHLREEDVPLPLEGEHERTSEASPKY